jgi:hypothetical protein
MSDDENIYSAEHRLAGLERRMNAVVERRVVKELG